MTATKPKPAWNVWSPDGFAIQYGTTYTTKAEARQALLAWIEGFRRQGYYSTARRDRINLEDLPYHCVIAMEDPTQPGGLPTGYF